MIEPLPEVSTGGARLDAMFRELCCGSEDALHVCWAFYQFLHVVDDLVDRDVPVAVDTVGFHLIAFTEVVACNPFFQAHRDLLMGAFRVAVVEWLDSEEWAKREDVWDKMAARVLKSQYQNLFFLIASLCGGVAHMRAMTAKYREYQYQ
jgi:hypothetical protein